MSKQNVQQEMKPLRGLLTHTGCEATSNDGQTKFCLKRVSYTDAEKGVTDYVFIAHVFTKSSGNLWEESNSFEGYPNVDSFVRVLDNVPSFSEAYNELNQQIKSNRRQGAALNKIAQYAVNE